MMVATASKLPEFHRISAILKQLNASSSASEAHGLMCGFICLGDRAEGFSWWELVTGNSMVLTTFDEGQHQPLIELYAYSWECITQMDFQFQLLIPSNEQSLLERAKSLGVWCQGFMTGLGMTGLTNEDINTPELRDALLHISEIAKMDYEQIEASDSDERAFVEVYEYIRLAVLNLYAEFVNTKKIGTIVQQADGEVH